MRLRPDTSGEVLSWRFLLLVAALALGFRLVVFLTAGQHQLFQHPVVDGLYHHQEALSVVQSNWTHAPTVFKPPLYPYFVALVYQWLGPRIAAVQWIQYALGAAAAVVIALLAARLLGARTGRIAGVLAALYVTFAFSECQLLPPVFSILFNAGALLLVTGDWAALRPARFLASGLLAGLSMGMRPDVVLPGALVLALFVLRERSLPRRGLAVRLACFAAGAALVLAPITWRNWRATGHLTLVSANDGINLYTGNARGADGISAVPIGLRWSRLMMRVPPELDDAASKSRFWRREALREMRAEPLHTAGLWCRKALAFVNRREFRNNVCFHFIERTAWPLALNPVRFAVVLPLAAWGFVALARDGDRRRRFAAQLCGLWVAGYWAVGIVFFVTERFRLPAIPMLLLPAASALGLAADAVRTRSVRTLAPAAAIVAAAVALSWPPWLGTPERGWVEDFTNLGNVFVEQRNAPAAVDAYGKALAIDPRDLEANFRMAKLLRSDPARAIGHLQVARAAIPDSPNVLLTLALAQREASDDAAAKATLEELVRRAETTNYGYEKAIWATAHLTLAELDPAAADTHWERAWAIDPRTTSKAAIRAPRDLDRVVAESAAELRERPGDWSALADYGRALRAAGRAADAVTPLAEAARRAPPGMEPVNLEYARALAQAGRRADAVRELETLRARLGPSPLREEVVRTLGELNRAPATP